MVSYIDFDSPRCSLKVSFDSQATVENIYSAEQNPYLKEAEFHAPDILIRLAKPQG